jgi:hypothetical protein
MVRSDVAQTFGSLEQGEHEENAEIRREQKGWLGALCALSTPSTSRSAAVYVADEEGEETSGSLKKREQGGAGVTARKTQGRR